jgi:hypothetical protein
MEFDKVRKTVCAVSMLCSLSGGPLCMQLCGQVFPLSCSNRGSFFRLFRSPPRVAFLASSAAAGQ